MNSDEPSAADRRRRRRMEFWTAVGAVAAVVALLITQSQLQRPPQPPVPSSAPPGPPVAAPILTPSQPMVRNSGHIVVAPGAEIDLDALAENNPQWEDIRGGVWDIRNTANFYDRMDILGSKEMSGIADYAQCRSTTGYKDMYNDIKDYQKNKYYCVKTNENRYAVVKISSVDMATLTIEVDVTTYDPPA